MQCKFCGSDKKLIGAHIIPAGFFRRLKRGQGPLNIMTNKDGEYNKKSWVGVYDRNIVCSDCESLWTEWDNYAQKLLADQPLNGQARYYGQQKIAYVVTDFKYEKLKLFFMSMLWRASASSHPFFSKVALGKFEEIVKEYISKSDPGASDEFSVTLAKFDHPLAKPTLDPHADKFSGVDYFRFYLASYIAYIKVDRKPTPMPLSQFAMAENRPLYIVCRDFTKSKELKLMQKLIGR